MPRDNGLPSRLCDHLERETGAGGKFHPLTILLRDLQTEVLKKIRIFTFGKLKESEAPRHLIESTRKAERFPYRRVFFWTKMEMRLAKPLAGSA